MVILVDSRVKGAEASVPQPRDAGTSPKNHANTRMTQPSGRSAIGTGHWAGAHCCRS